MAPTTTVTATATQSTICLNSLGRSNIDLTMPQNTLSEQSTTVTEGPQSPQLTRHTPVFPSLSPKRTNTLTESLISDTTPNTPSSPTDCNHIPQVTLLPRKLSLSPEEHTASTTNTSPDTPPPTSAELHAALAQAISERDSALEQLVQQRQQCAECPRLCANVEKLERRNASMRTQLKTAVHTTQTHGQRLLRAAFQQRLTELQHESAQRTTSMLNLQKKCFEEQLAEMDAEAGAALHNLQRQLENVKSARISDAQIFQSERDAALEKAATTMQAVERKMSQLHARCTRLEREKRALAASVAEKQVMIDVLASAASARDVERRRLDLLSKTHEEERTRKNAIIDSLHAEIATQRTQLSQERELCAALIERADTIQACRQDDSMRNAEEMQHCKQRSKTEVDRLGRLFASMIQDFAAVPPDVSTDDR